MAGRTLALLSFFLLASHGLRIGSPGAALFWLLGGFLVFSRQAWTKLVAAVFLIFGSSLWVTVGFSLIHDRLETGSHWIRLAAIVAAVALVALWAGILHSLEFKKSTSAEDRCIGLAFLLTTGALSIAKFKAGLDIMLLDRFFPTFGWVTIFLLGWYAAWITEKMVDRDQSPKWRRIIWSLFSAFFFGQLLLGLAGIEQFLMTGKLHLPVPALIAAGPLYRGEGFFMIILFSITLILVGPAWCSHLCYIGAWDNLLACSKKKATPFPSYRKSVRIALCLLVFGTAVILRLLEAPAWVALSGAAAFGLCGVFLMLTWSRHSGVMTHCTMYCPMGLLADIVGKINPWRIEIKEGCTGCGRCSRACRYDALTASDIKSGRPGLSCSLCGDCLTGCPHNQLVYTFPGISPESARLAFIVTVVSLHATFIGVARL